MLLGVFTFINAFTKNGSDLDAVVTLLDFEIPQFLFLVFIFRNPKEDTRDVDERLLEIDQKT